MNPVKPAKGLCRDWRRSGGGDTPAYAVLPPLPQAASNVIARISMFQRQWPSGSSASLVVAAVVPTDGRWRAAIPRRRCRARERRAEIPRAEAPGLDQRPTYAMQPCEVGNVDGRCPVVSPRSAHACPAWAWYCRIGSEQSRVGSSKVLIGSEVNGSCHR